MFTGSMVGAGSNVFAVWSYVLSHTRDGLVEINPTLLAFYIGASEGEIIDSIRFLCNPDPKSRSKECEGRRMIPATDDGEFPEGYDVQTLTYRVVNFERYRALRSEEDRREYMREYMKEVRQKKKKG